MENYPDGDGGGVRLEVAIVVGTRPEIIKMAPVIKKLTERELKFCFVLTGQHYEYEMSMQFVEELGLPQPTTSFRLENSKPASQIGEMMTNLEPILGGRDCRLLLIQGDTNSMLAAALTGVKLGLKVAHIEAGLRCYDWRTPEEHNRRMVDHVSDILFAPTETAARNLTDEHVYGKIVTTGNTVVDAVDEYLPIALRSSNIMKRVSFHDFCLATFHRKESVDSPEILRNFVEILDEIDLPIVFPVHPRTNMRLREQGLYEKLARSPRVCLLPPVGYFDNLVLMKQCRLILTDSGGLQEEGTVPSIRKPIVILRTSTERPEAIQAGFAKLAGVDKKRVLHTVKELLKNPPRLPLTSPFGDGEAATRIVDALSDY